jgi:hypothetical protein
MIFAATYHRHIPIEHSPAERAYELLRDADFLPLLLGAGIVFYAGFLAAARYPKVYHMGKWLGGLGFLAYVAAGVSFDGYDPLDCLFAYAVKGGVFATLTIGASRLIATIAIWTWDILMFVPGRLANHRANARRRAEAEARRLEEERERQRREEHERVASEERRRLAIEYEKRQQDAARRSAGEEQRRMDARAECELCYSQHVKEIARRFPKSMFDAFLRTYMSPNQTVESVERRAKELQRIIQCHRDAAKPPKKIHTMQDLATWFLQEKEHIESLAVDEELRQEQMVALNVRYSDLAQTILEKMEP